MATIDYTSGNPSAIAAPGQVPVSLGGFAPTPALPQSGANPYAILNYNLANILNQIAIKGSQQSNIKRGAVADVTGNAVDAAAVPYDPKASTATNAQNYTGTLQSFAPALGSLQNQYEGFNSDLNNFGNEINAAETAYKPFTVGAGQSVVTPGGTVILSGTEYSPQVDPMTGELKLLPLNTLGTSGATGTGNASGAGSGSTENNDSSYKDALMRYNGNTDLQYASKVAGIKSTLDSISPTATADSLNQYIATYPKATINGTMIMQVAGQYGLNPNWLAAQLALESHFGATSPGNNPGGLHFANQPGATRGPAVDDGSGSYVHYAQFKSPLDGLYAFADLMKNTVGSSTSPTTATPTPSNTGTSAIGGQFSPSVSTRIEQLSPVMRTFVDAGPKGVGYINDNRVPDLLKNGTKIQAAKAGIPYLTGDEAANIKGIGIVYDSVAKLQGLVQSTLGTGLVGRAKGLTLNQALQSAEVGGGPSLKQFDQFRSQAINNLKALTAGGTTFRITQSEIDTAVSNIPGSTDNQETAYTDLATLTSFIDSKLAATFPYTSGTAGGANGGGTMRVKLSNGQTGTINAAEFNPSTMTQI